MISIAVFFGALCLAAANDCCDSSSSCRSAGETCSKSECLQGPDAGIWSCGTYRGRGEEDDCLFLPKATCGASQLPGSQCVDLEGQAGYCEDAPPVEQGPSWLLSGQRVCARRLHGEGRCEGAKPPAPATIQPGARRNHIAEMKRRRAQEQEALIERALSHLRQRDQPQAEEVNAVVM
eukprot:gb/GFBE01031921.1/.p1 GENE.gb/GFBE01031921.1/~~gb/GFBE01031921.1/.p1  ORF type:complete len:178 (+),score=28.56 gb/GFBE01031921.1/:1-534(+)